MAYVNKSAANKNATKNEEKEEESTVITTTNELTKGSEDNITISKSEFEQMKAQMQMLMQMMAMSNNAQAQEKKPEKQIPFVNMTKGKFVLKGSAFYTIEKQFETRRFIEREARLIVNNMPESIRDGKVYILDADFVRDCELDSVYETLLSDKQMMELLDKEPAYIIEVYKNANDSQKKIIVDMIENKKLSGEFVDANVLLQIGQLCGKNLIEMQPFDDMKEG